VATSVRITVSTGRPLTCLQVVTDDPTLICTPIVVIKVSPRRRSSRSAPLALTSGPGPEP
jgi:hypothetical protein